jgi:hypothetical protein
MVLFCQFVRRWRDRSTQAMRAGGSHGAGDQRISNVKEDGCGAVLVRSVEMLVG